MRTATERSGPRVVLRTAEEGGGGNNGVLGGGLVGGLRPDCAEIGPIESAPTRSQQLGIGGKLEEGHTSV